jgi:electron transport complex protein RnfB
MALAAATCGWVLLSAIETGTVAYYLTAVAVVAGLGAAFGLVLYVAGRVFAVESDPRVDQIEALLSGANCGGCGFAGCRAYAEAVVKGHAQPGQCAPSGAEASRKIAEVMGVAFSQETPKVAVVHCRGGRSRAKSRGEYAGVRDCRAALVPGAGGGPTACAYGCLGMGTCVAACPFGAMAMGPDGLPQVVESLCTGCGKCVASCPRGLISLHGRDRHVLVMCRSHDRGKDTREVCEVGCIACRLCEKSCKFDAIHVVDNVAVIDDAKCKNCGACVKVCPRGTIWNLRKARKEVEKLSAVGG